MSKNAVSDPISTNTLVFEVRYDDDVFSLVCVSNQNNPVAQDDVTVVESGTGGDTSPSSQDIKIKASKSTFESLRVTSGGSSADWTSNNDSTWRRMTRTVTLQAGFEVEDLEFTVTAKTNSSNGSKTWTLDPFVRLQRQGYTVSNPTKAAS